MQRGAAELAAYVNSLGKPLKQIMLSHPHPDHFAGYERNFAGVDLVSTAKVSEIADAEWATSGAAKRLQGRFGDEAPNMFVKAEAALSAGMTDLDGIAMEVQMHEDAEAAAQNTFWFPEQKVLIAQDLVYSGAHHFPLGNNEGWVELLKTLRGSSEADLVLCGHGLPTDRDGFDNSINYLNLLNTAMGEEDNADAVVARLDAAYPSYGAARMKSFINFLFPKQ